MQVSTLWLRQEINIHSHMTAQAACQVFLLQAMVSKEFNSYI